MAAGDGLPELVTPYNTTEFEQMINAIQSHANALTGQFEVVAADLRRLLPRATNVRGRAGMFGLDLHMAARQIAKQLAQAGGSANSMGSAASKALQYYHGNFVAPTGAHSRGQFDAGK